MSHKRIEGTCECGSAELLSDGRTWGCATCEACGWHVGEQRVPARPGDVVQLTLEDGPDGGLMTVRHVRRQDGSVAELALVAWVEHRRGRILTVTHLPLAAVRPVNTGDVYAAQPSYDDRLRDEWQTGFAAGWLDAWSGNQARPVIAEWPTAKQREWQAGYEAGWARCEGSDVPSMAEMEADR